MNIATKHGLGKVLPPLIGAGLAAIAVLAAMSSSAGIQGSGFASQLAIGPVTEPVSNNIVVVSGIPYSTANAVIQIDGHGAVPGQIQAGDVVSVIATTDPAAGGAASARQVTFNGGVQGKVSNVDAPAATLFVLGQTVRVTSKTAFGPDIGPAGLAGLQNGEVVEVSGFANSVGELVATRIEAKGRSNVSRVVGNVRTLDPARHTFYINSLKIDYGSANVRTVLTDSASVNVQGVKFAADGTLIADLVRASSSAHSHAGWIGRIQGLITSYPSNAYFEVNGQPVVVGAQTSLHLPVPLGLDVEVNVTGTFDTGGVLVADSVQSSR